MHPNKPEIITALRQSLSAELSAMERVAAMSRDEAGSEESKSENQYDTRATEASYLARGLGLRILALRKLVAWFERFDPTQPLSEASAQVGALIALEGAASELLFLAPTGGGKVQAGGYQVNVISPSSPLGEALLGLEAGDTVEVETPRGARAREILAVW